MSTPVFTQLKLYFNARPLVSFKSVRLKNQVNQLKMEAKFWYQYVWLWHNLTWMMGIIRNYVNRMTLAKSSTKLTRWSNCDSWFQENVIKEFVLLFCPSKEIKTVFFTYHEISFNFTLIAFNLISSKKIVYLFSSIENFSTREETFYEEKMFCHHCDDSLVSLLLKGTL